MLNVGTIVVDNTHQPSTPLFDALGNEILRQRIPFLNNCEFQLFNIRWSVSVNTLLKGSPDGIVDGFKIWTICRPHCRFNEVNAFMTKKFNCPERSVSWSSILLQSPVVCPHLSRISNNSPLASTFLQ